VRSVSRPSGLEYHGEVAAGPDSPAIVAPRTPLVGRAADVAAVSRWLDEGERLVAITGPVGIGKTRVAQEVALVADVTSSVAWVDAAGALDEASLVDALLRSLGAAEDVAGPADPIGRAGRALAARGDLLLVLDGLDALAARAAPVIDAWLRAAPELLVLVASRERTRLPGEIVHELGPLPEADALFTSFAQRTRAGFQPSEADREAITAIARELDGVPLAIELAAQRLSVMGPRAILHRLRSNAPGAAGLDRALEGAWVALDEAEQRALAALTVFHGGFTLEAAEVVIGAGARPAIEVVAALRDKSALVAREGADGDVRLDLLGATRAFVQRKLDAEPEVRAAAEARHAAYFGERAAELARSSDPAARAALLGERENLLAIARRVAGHGAVSARAAAPALRALLALAPALIAKGPLAAFEVLVDPAIASTRDSGADPALVAEVLLVRGALHRHRGSSRAGARDLVHALGIARTVARPAIEARATFELAHALADAGDLAAAEEHLRRAADLFSVAGSRSDEGRAHAALGELLARAGRVEEARVFVVRALGVHEADPEARAEDLLALAAIDRALGRVGDARAAAEEALALAAGGRASALASAELGKVAHRAGDRAAARASLERAASLFEELGYAALAASAQGHLGVIALEEGRAADAEARLAAACAALGEPRPGTEAETFARHLAAVRSPSSGPPPPPDDALVVGEGAAWFRPPRGARVGLERRRSLAQVAARLAVERLERPGHALPSAALREAGWPGEKLQAAAGAHRVRVAISTLRKLGLPIVTGEDGWALDPAIVLVRA